MSSSWQSRVRSSVKLTSPSGLTFEPGFHGGESSVEKRVGRFGFPGINGTLTQDLGSEGIVYTFDLLFEGADNDRESLRFLRALRETGPWTVVHPVDGQLTLQPLGTPKRPTDPVASGNLTIVPTEWIIPLDAEAAASTVNDVAEVDAAADSLASEVADSTARSTRLDSAAQATAVVSSVRRQAAALKRSLVTVVARVNAIQSQLDNLINSAILDAAQIAGSVLELIRTPGLVAGSVVSKVKALAALGERLIAQLPTADTLDLPGRNEAVIGELFLAATATAMADTIIAELPDTRSQALAELALFDSYLDDMTTALDALTDATADADFDAQFFGGQPIAQALARLRASISSYLLGIIGDLKIERRLILDRDRATLEIAITEYEATAADADAYYELLCLSNHLHGRQLLRLPAGTEVVFYA